MPFRHTQFIKPGFFPVPCQFGASAILICTSHRGVGKCDHETPLRELLTQKEGDSAFHLSSHFIWSLSQTKGNVWHLVNGVGRLQHISPDDWKVLESIPSFCCSVLMLAQFRSIQYRWDYCMMVNVSSCSCALQWLISHWLCNDY